jgi:hypothetical protein
MYCKGPARCSLASFTNLTGTLSVPVDVSERSLSISHNTSRCETGRKENDCCGVAPSERESMNLSRFESAAGLVPNVLSFVKTVITTSFSATTLHQHPVFDFFYGSRVSENFRKFLSDVI